MSERQARRPKAIPRTAYLVLGMHRSGTSAATQLLASAGADLPANPMPGDEHNEQGYFEPWKIAILNDGRLRAAASAWDDVFAFPFRPLPDAAERDWLARAGALFGEEYGRATFPLMKDPRATVLMPFWREVLKAEGVAARCVIPVRRPLAVAGSLRRRDGFTDEKSVLLWAAYMLAAEAYTRDLPRAFVGYDALLQDWRAEAGRIEAAHGAPLPRLTQAAARRIDQFLSPDLRHNAADAGLARLGWAGELADAVHRWFVAAANGDAADRSLLEDAAAELARRADEVGVLVSPMARDLDAARAELLDLRAQVDQLRLEMERQQRAMELGWQSDLKRLEIVLEAERRTMARASELLGEALAED